MKKNVYKLTFAIACLALLSSVSSCSKDNHNPIDIQADNLYELINESDADEVEYRSILQSYVDGTIVPTYKSLAEAALEMRTANEALKTNPTDQTMQAASAAWMKARIAWEKSEAFLFGPVGDQALDIDAHIDSWPLEKNEIDAVLANDAAGLTGQKAWKDLDAEVIGFHVTEYLIYRDGQPRLANSLTSAELKYLTAATDALVWDCILAYTAWVGKENLPADMKNVLEENPDVEAFLNDNPNYKNFAQTLKNATGIYRNNVNSALSEIATGAAKIAGEVGSTKIASPYEDKKTEEVESWYSWHSLDDYQNNIHSIKNAYLGGTGDNSRSANSLSTFVAKTNPQLDNQIKAQIEDCIAKIAAIGKGNKSFYEVVRDQINAAEVDAAVEACTELQKLFKK